MKAYFVFLGVMGLIAASTSLLFAGGIENKHNWSAEWVRTLNRNAAIDSADAVSYNPAGVMKLDDGRYLNVTGQYALKTYANTFQGTKYETDDPDAVPSLFALYKEDKWAAYGAVTVVVAGGQIDYGDGSTTTFALAQQILAATPLDTLISHQLEGRAFSIGYTLGGAYAINEMISVSLGARYVDASREFKGNAELGVAAAPGDFAQTFEVDYEETGNGWGGILGVNMAPSKALNIGLRYETKTSIDLSTDVNEDDVNIVTDGDNRNRDLPALLGLGVSYVFTPQIRVETNLTYYFNEDADWEDNPVTSADETEKDNGYDMGLALEYTFNPKWRASVGYMYTEVGLKADNMSIETPELDAQTIAAGVAFKPAPRWDFNFGVLKTFYDDATTTSGIEFEKEVVIIALGLQYRF
jgi:long-chain fatty acid transport protein